MTDTPSQDAAAPETLPALVIEATPERRLYNADVGSWVDSTPRRQQQAQFLHQQVQAATLVQAIAIERIHEEALYLELGYDTWTDYCNVALDLSASHVRKLRAIAGQVAGLLPDDWSERRMLTSGAEQANADALSSLGVGKLYQLASHNDEVDLSHAIDEGVVVIGGARHSLEDLKAMTVREVSSQFASQKAAMRERIAVLEEEKKYAEAERDALKKQQEEVETRYKTAKGLESLHGRAAADLEKKQSRLAEARRHFTAFSETLTRVGVTLEDPAALKIDLLDLLDLAEHLLAGHLAEATDLRIEQIDNAL